MLKIDKNGETCGRQIDIVVSGFNMKIFGVLNFRDTGISISKNRDFGESFQLQNLRKIFIVCHAKAITYNYQLEIRPDGSKNVTEDFEC